MVIDDDGIMTVFQDDAADEIRICLDLNGLTTRNIVESQSDINSASFRLSVGAQPEPIQFAFETEQQRDEMVQSIKRFVVDLGEFVDFALFQNMEHHDDCKEDEHCPAVQRILQSLDLFAALKSSTGPIPKEHGDGADEEFTEFMDRHYGESNVVIDYVHFLDRHFEPDSLRKIAKRLRFGCDAVGRCKGTQRRFRERGGSGMEQKEETTTNHYIDTLDTVHFLLCHLDETGLRVPAELLQSEIKAVDEEEDEDTLVDAVIQRMTREIASRRRVLGVDRFDGATNSKFNISTMETKVDGVDGLLSFESVSRSVCRSGNV